MKRDPLIVRAHVLTRIASTGLALLLLAVVAFGARTFATTQAAETRTKAALAADGRYQAVRYWLAREESQESKYRAAPRPDVWVAHEDAATRLMMALKDLREHASGRDRKTVDRIIAAQLRYHRATEVLFTAVDAHDPRRTEQIADTLIAPPFSFMSETIDDQWKIEHHHAVVAFESLGASLALARHALPIVLGLAAALAAGLLVVLRFYRRRIDRSLHSEIERLERDSLRDHLTMLGNHRAFHESIVRSISRASRTTEALSLALIDIDEFKVLNDRNGHAYGDQVLASFAALLGEMRSGDRAFRIGGDEFAVLLPHTTLAEAYLACERLRERTSLEMRGITISIGIADLAPTRFDANSLKEQADAALYEAKRRGRDDVVTIDTLEDIGSIVSSFKVNALRDLISGGTVDVVFQPIWDMANNAVLGYEALARLPARCRLAGPQEAFDVAERIGRAHVLDALCRNAVLARAADLPPDVLLFLNMSPQTLDHDVLGGTSLMEAVTAAGLTPDRVVLEITERSIARQEVVIREAKRLQSLGFKLALDDTGAGNSGLEMLSRLPVDFVKIDRNVIVSAMDDRMARGVLAGIIAIAYQTQTYVIAEGIDDPLMLQMVREAGTPVSDSCGVHGAQGYLLGRPSPFIDPGEEMPSMLGGADVLA